MIANTKKISSVLALILLAGIAVIPVALPPTAAAAPACDAAHTMRMTMLPIPDSFNDLTAHGSADFIMAWATKLSLSPFPDLPNGSMNWAEAITNSITTNSNYTQWVFHIKPDMKWSDGTSVTAQDVLNTYSPSYALNPNYDIEALGSEITSRVANSSTTAVFNLNVTDAHFAEKISNYISFSIEPPSVVALGPDNNMFSANPGDGPFYLSQDYTSGSTEAVLSANPYYQPKSNICELDVNFVESSGYINQFLVSGQTDLSWPLAPGAVQTLESYPNVHIAISPAQWETSISWNVAASPYNQTFFRQALAYAINDSQVVQTMFGYGVSAQTSTGGVPQTQPWYDPHQQTYPFNPTTAKTLLTSNGYTYDSKGMLHYPNGTQVKLTLWTDTAKPQDIPAAPIVQQDLAAIGIDLTVETVSVQDLRASFASGGGAYNDMVLYTSAGPVFADQWLDGQLPCNVLGTPGCHDTVFAPQSQLNNYQGNITALDATYGAQAEQKYLNNIQEMQATYLPNLPLAYPDIIVGYTTNHFTNWPVLPSTISLQPDRFNNSMFAGLQPVSQSSTTTQSSATVSPTTTGTQTASTQTTGTQTTTSTTSGSTDLYYIAAAIVVVVVVVVGSIAYLARARRPKT